MHLTRRLTKHFLLMIDVDHFKPINDTHGHLVGDQILKQLADLMNRHAKRAADVVCRYGGEEFAIILPETDLDDAKTFAEQLLAIVRKHKFETDVGGQRITISAGVISTSNRIFDNVEELFKAADEALYNAKNQGRDQVAG